MIGDIILVLLKIDHMKHMVKKIMEVSGKLKLEKSPLIGKISFTDGIFLIKVRALNIKKKINIFLER